MNGTFKTILVFCSQALQVPSAVTYNLYDFSFDDVHMSDDDTLLVGIVVVVRPSRPDAERRCHLFFRFSGVHPNVHGHGPGGTFPHRLSGNVPVAVEREKELPVGNVPQLEARVQRRSDDVFHYNRTCAINWKTTNTVLT